MEMFTVCLASFEGQPLLTALFVKRAKRTDNLFQPGRNGFVLYDECSNACSISLLKTLDYNCIISI